MGGNIQEGRRTNELWGAFGEASIVTCVKVMEHIDQYICDTQRMGIDEISSQKGPSLGKKPSSVAEVKSKVKLYNMNQQDALFSITLFQ